MQQENSVSTAKAMDFVEQHAYGVSRQYVVRDEMDGYVEDIFYKGWTTIPDVLSADEVSKITESTLEIYDNQVKEFGEEELARMNDRFIVRAPLCYDDKFTDLATHPALMDFCKRVLGDNFVLLMQNGIINNPVSRQYQTRWHRDLNYQHWVSTKPLSINALFCLTDFNVKTGGTHILSGTHLREEFPSERFVLANEACVNVPAGTLILMDAMLYHRAGANTSDHNRIGINHVIGLPFLAQQVNLSESLELKPQYEKFAPYFGFKWSAASSPSEWRRRKL